MVKVDIDIRDYNWKKYIRKSYIKSLIDNIFKKLLALLVCNFEVKTIVEMSIIFTNDSDIRKINKKYRNINLPTNVLSFPTYETEFFEELMTNRYLFIGDIILSLDTIIKESAEQNKNFLDHLIHLLTHSLLHLLGFDHMKYEDAKKMEDLEIELLKQLNIANPY